MKIKTYSVSEVNRYINNSLEGDPILNALTVNGELSNFKRYPSGHVYFTLKDADAKLPCVIFKSAMQYINEDFSDGDSVVVNGHISVYQREGRYQLICNHMAKQGRGRLYEQFLKLRDSLEKKGYFDKNNKKPLPLVWRVGLVTSKNGAAVKDFCTILARRNPMIDVTLYPVLVQGEQAAGQIVKAIEYFNTVNSVDVIVLTRGGGAIEDLWAFNDAQLAESIYQSEIAVVSAVGHEVDFTIADFVSDLRAATPSEAAEIISISIDEYRDKINELYNRMTRQLDEKCSVAKLAVEQLRPQNRLAHLAKQIADNKLNCHYLIDDLTNQINSLLANKRHLLERQYQALKYQNPLTILEKGYVLVSDCKGKIVTSAKRLEKSDAITLRFVDGTLEAIITEDGND